MTVEVHIDADGNVSVPNSAKVAAARPTILQVKYALAEMNKDAVVLSEFRGKCTAPCYNAAGENEDCACPCEGANHGTGFPVSELSEGVLWGPADHKKEIYVTPGKHPLDKYAVREFIPVTHIDSLSTAITGTWTDHEEIHATPYDSEDKKYRNHRESFEWAYGTRGSGYVDHMCHRTRCNYPAHLRLITSRANSVNKCGSFYDYVVRTTHGIPLLNDFDWLTHE